MTCRMPSDTHAVSLATDSYCRQDSATGPYRLRAEVGSPGRDRRRWHGLPQSPRLSCRGGMALVEQVRSDADSAPVPAKLGTLLAIAAAVTHSGLSVTADLVVQARAAGATDLEIHDTGLIAAAFCMFNRYVDGLATTAPDDPALYSAAAQRLIKHGSMPPPAEPSRRE